MIPKSVLAGLVLSFSLGYSICYLSSPRTAEQYQKTLVEKIKEDPKKYEFIIDKDMADMRELKASIPYEPIDGFADFRKLRLISAEKKNRYAVFLRYDKQDIPLYEVDGKIVAGTMNDNLAALLRNMKAGVKNF